MRQDAPTGGEKLSDTDVQRRVVTEAKRTPEREWLADYRLTRHAISASPSLAATNSAVRRSAPLASLCESGIRTMRLCESGIRTTKVRGQSSLVARSSCPRLVRQRPLVSRAGSSF